MALLSQVRTTVSPLKFSTLSRVPARTGITVSVCCVTGIASVISESTANNIRFSSSALDCRQSGNVAQQLDLLAERAREVIAQVGAAGIGRERLPRLVDRLVDDLQVLPDHLHGAGVELALVRDQRLLQLRHRRVILRAAQAG